MCGICGILHLRNPRPAEPAIIERMNQQLFHRGPDDSGTRYFERGALAMRRLSIVDLQTGHQPLSNEDGSVWIVCNGEIYNHAELRPDLEARGHRYSTRSDTETIVHLYEEYGLDCVQRLRGMFAFVIWDARRRRLFAVRDRLGIKPLYYCRTAEDFIFGSEIKAVLAGRGVRAELNRRAIPEYLAFGYLSGPETLFEGIHKLPPGHTLHIDESGTVDIRQYWDLPLGVSDDGKPESYYVETYHELLEQAVRSHLMADVPLGMFLSGGVDSSAVAALMTRIRREPILTFAVGYEEAQHSEVGYARTVAEHIGSAHREVIVSQEEFFGVLPKLIWHEDEPIAWPSSVPLYFVAQLAREHVKVVLTGEGSDETLGGYTRYPMTLWNSRLSAMYGRMLPLAMRQRLRAWLHDGHSAPGSLRRKLQHSLLGRDAADWNALYFDNFYCAFPGPEQHALLTSELRAIAANAYSNVLVPWQNSRGDLLERLLYTDIKTYLVELLMKQDQMSMAASIESRVPFLDHVLVEFAMSIPSRYKIHGLSGKWTLKKAMRGVLPDSILFRPKMGFPTPWRSWLVRGAKQVDDVLLGGRSTARKLFQPDALRRLLAEHRTGVKDNSDRLWRLLNLELWQRVFLDGEATNEGHSFRASLP